MAIFFASYRPAEKTWVAIGDSITYLNDHPNETGDRVTKGYLTAVTDEYPGLRYINKGYNGWTSGGIAQNIDKLGLVPADIYTVFLGTNDWWSERPLGVLTDYTTNKGNSTVYGSFRIIVNKLRSLNPGAKIILITPMQRNDFVYIADHKNKAYGSYRAKKGQTLEAFANAIDSIGQADNIPVVDLYHNRKLDIKKLVKFKRLKDTLTGQYKNYKYPASIDIPFDPSKDDYPYPIESVALTYDGLHPSDAGYAIITDALLKVFKKLDFKSAINTQKLASDTLPTRWTKYIDLDTYNKPFWNTDVVVDESVQVIRDGSQTTSKLLLPAKTIVSVRAADYSKVFVQGKDWEQADGKLVIPAASTVPFLTPADLIFDKPKPGNSFGAKTAGKYVLYNSGSYFMSKQILVTYIPAAGTKWQGPVPKLASGGLPNTIALLKKSKAIKVAFLGNSIEVGLNASNLEKLPPFMPNWPELLIHNLRKNYGKNVSFVNRSVSGMMAKWGMDSVSRITSQQPNLVVIGFGMNDGTQRVAPDVYRTQIKGIIDAVKATNPNAEFILVAPMLANPDSGFDGLQRSYKVELDKLAGKGTIVADMTAVHAELLKHKTYQDMTGNNINHPNDYLSRWYAQLVAGYLVK
ncbi:hypothetical protein GCM10028827_10860 [Mucilaginibacter myungsuensis]